MPKAKTMNHKEAPADVITPFHLQSYELGLIPETENPITSFEEFFKRAFPRALNQALKAGSREAEDIASESLLSMWRRWDTIGASTYRLNDYLATTVTRKLIDSSRHTKARPPEILCDFRGDASKTIESAMAQGHYDKDATARRIIGQGIASHIPSRHQPFWLRLASNTSKEEIADDARLSPHTVKTHIQKVRRYLNDELRENGL